MATRIQEESSGVKYLNNPTMNPDQRNGSEPTWAEQPVRGRSHHSCSFYDFIYIAPIKLVNLTQDIKEQNELMSFLLLQVILSLIATYWWETGTTVLLLADQQNDMNQKKFCFSTETQLIKPELWKNLE